MRREARSSVRVILDVNVLIRVALRSGAAARLLRTTLESDAVVLTSIDLRDEFAKTARKPRLSGHIDWEVHNLILGILGSRCEPIQVQPPFPPCRDAADGYLLAMAEVGRADYLVTSDRDLLELGQLGSCRMVSPVDFGAILGQ